MKWIAAKDGTAHAHASRRATRTACDKPAIDERVAWPSLRLCAECVAAIEKSAGTPAGGGTR